MLRPGSFGFSIVLSIASLAAGPSKGTDVAPAFAVIAPFLKGSMDSIRIRSASRSVAFAMLLITASFVLVKTGRDALFVQQRGIFDLPIAYLGMAALSFPTAFAMLALIRGLGPRRARPFALFGVAGILATFWQIAEPGGGIRMTALFLAVPLLYGVLFSATWLLAAELFRGLASERIAEAYARIGAGSILGGLFGGIGARVLAPVLPPEAYFGIGALVLAASAVVVVIIQASHVPRPMGGEVVDRPGLSSARKFLSNRYGVLLLALGILGAVVGVLIEFQFYWAASSSRMGGREQTIYFANLYLLLNAAALAVQFGVMPRVQRSFGIVGSLMVMPAMLLGGAVLVSLSAGLTARGALRATEGGLKASIHRTSWEQAFLPVRSDRAVAKLVVDGLGAHLGAGLAALPLYLWLHLVVESDPLSEHRDGWMIWSLMIATAALIMMTRRLGSELRANFIAGDPGDEPAPPPDCCAVTATLGRIVQEEECLRRYGAEMYADDG